MSPKASEPTCHYCSQAVKSSVAGVDVCGSDKCRLQANFNRLRTFSLDPDDLRDLSSLRVVDVNARIDQLIDDLEYIRRQRGRIPIAIAR